MKKFLLSIAFLFSMSSMINAQVIISQYYEGAGTNKWIELTNVGSTAINMGTSQLRLAIWVQGGSTGNININGNASNIFSLTGTINAGQTILIGNTGNGSEVPYLTAGSATLTNNNVTSFNGNDGIALLDGTNTIIDAFGHGINAQDVSYVRNSNITNQNPSFDLAEWTQVSLTTVQNATSTENNYLGYHVAVQPICTEPDQPTILNLSSTSTTVSGSFTASNADHYLIIRNTIPTLSSLPNDGTIYAVGNSVGGGTVVANTPATTFTDNGLTQNTTYYYFVFGYNADDCSGGPNYNISSPLWNSTTTQILQPCVSPNAPTTLNLVAANTSINGSFTASANANNYLIVYSTSSSLGQSPVNGTTYTAGQTFGSGRVVSYSPNTNFTISGLTLNTTYYVFVFASNNDCIGEPFYNTSSLNGTVTTTANTTGIPTGYYDAANDLTCQPLKTALKTIISTNYHQLTYADLWTAFQYTDIKPGTNPRLIWDIYTDDNNPAVPETYNFVYSTNQCGNATTEGVCYNREHSMPKSWFSDGYPMYTDLMHLYPVDGYVNTMRSNFPYGMVSSATYTSIDNQSKKGTGSNNGYTGTVFEPFSAFKGDLARTYFYMATRYEDEIISQNWAGVNPEANAAMLTTTDQPDPALRRLYIYDNWYLKTIYQWSKQDPVSQKEIDRNNAIYYQSGQGNRNPFIDHPEYIDLIFNCYGLLPVVLTKINAIKSNENIIVKWNVENEISFSHYSVERSTNGYEFYEIGTVNGQSLNNYQFTDENVPANNLIYYRIKTVDRDGSFTYSEIVAVRMNPNIAVVNVYPNPANDRVNLKFSEPLKRATNMIITDVMGRIVLKQDLQRGQVATSFAVRNLANGKYFIRLISGEEVTTQTVIVVK